MEFQRTLSKNKKILCYLVLRLLFSILILKIILSLGFLFMDEFSRIWSAFPGSSSTGIGGDPTPNMPPGLPGPSDKEVLIVGSLDNERENSYKSLSSDQWIERHDWNETTSQPTLKSVSSCSFSLPSLEPLEGMDFIFGDEASSSAPLPQQEAASSSQPNPEGPSSHHDSFVDEGAGTSTLPEAPIPLFDDETRRSALSSYCRHRWDTREEGPMPPSVVEKAFDLEKETEKALLEDGFSRQEILSKMEDVRSLLFLNQKKTTIRSVTLLNKMRKTLFKNGVRSTPTYRKIKEQIRVVIVKYTGY